MHAADLVDLAGLIASQAGPLLRITRQISDRQLERYWTASKCRLDRWGHLLHELKQSRDFALDRTRGSSRGLWPVVEEIFSGDLLARVWTGVLLAFQARHAHAETEPVARSVLLGHMEARCRALTLLSNAPEFALNHLVELNRLRRSCERWSDLLVAQLACFGDMTALAHDLGRMRDFADELGDRTNAAVERSRWSVLQTSLRASFDSLRRAASPNADLNGQIAASILACYPPELFDGAGVFRASWLARLTATVDDAEALLDDFFLADSPDRFSKPGRGGLSRF